ncbi:hypothetical protein SDC9_115472 [bioreactor metagenome]|uniref:Uncharacterized protein n=1 Tax=bioreactor metagenome TaxID=1076179 RepID=A0A645BSZ3_9ZZZZ
MAIVQVESALIPVPVQKPATAEVMGLVHTEMDPATGKRLAPKSDHFLYELITGRFVDQDHAVGIFDVRVGPPSQNRFQVAKRLNGGAHFDSKRGGISVNLTDFGHGIGSTHITEIGLTLQPIGVFRVKHRQIAAHQRKAAQPVFEMAHTDDSGS